MGHKRVSSSRVRVVFGVDFASFNGFCAVMLDHHAHRCDRQDMGTAGLQDTATHNTNVS